MAFTYLVLNITVIVAAAFALSARFKKPGTRWWMTFAALIALTLIFDNIFIGLGMFTYNPELILGVTIGVAPIEDFLYSLLACIIVPLLWNRFKSPNHKEGRQ